MFVLATFNYTFDEYSVSGSKVKVSKESLHIYKKKIYDVMCID